MNKSSLRWTQWASNHFFGSRFLNHFSYVVVAWYHQYGTPHRLPKRTVNRSGYNHHLEKNILFSEWWKEHSNKQLFHYRRCGTVAALSLTSSISGFPWFFDFGEWLRSRWVGCALQDSAHNSCLFLGQHGVAHGWTCSDDLVIEYSLQGRWNGLGTEKCFLLKGRDANIT
jgi:hypothetical protein